MKKTFYTTQSIMAWEISKKTGILKSSLEFEDYSVAYKWMKQQMEYRIKGYSRMNGIIWLEKNKPKYSIIKRIKNEKMVVLKVKLDTSRVLPSLFYPWDTIRYNFMTYNKILEEEFYEVYSMSPEGIFDTKGYNAEEIQYTTGEIYLKDIKLIKVIN